MKVTIQEYTERKTKCLKISFNLTEEDATMHNFRDPELLEKLGSFGNTHRILFQNVKTVVYYTRFNLPHLFTLFPNMRSLHISGSSVLQFPDLSNLKRLKSVFIDNYRKPTKLNNIWTADYLEELNIGTFTFSGPISIPSFDEIVKCSKLKKLILSYSKFPEDELKKIIKLQELKEFGIHQKIETETLAFLSAKMNKVNSNELRAWQKIPANHKDENVKINGKRKPYLNLKRDYKRIIKYEENFELLKKKYLS